MGKRGNRGFTMVEMLTAIGILVILMGVSFVTVLNYQRGMKQQELDQTARELFVAAQNHLTMAESQGLLFNTASGDDEWGEDGGRRIFYVNPNDHSQLNSGMLAKMLPEFSIDDTVRLGGSYIIECNLPTSLNEPAVVTNVFYSDQTNLSQCEFSDRDQDALIPSLAQDTSDAKEGRRNYNGAVIGWFGGQGLNWGKPELLEPPQITVYNEGRLWIKSDQIPGVTDSGTCIQLIVTGNVSKRSRIISRINPNKDMTALEFNSNEQFRTIKLDDVTDPTFRFFNKCCAGADGDGLIPGEDITIYARVYNNNTLSTVATSAKKQTNSLFAGMTESADGSREVMVANIRHLENLDKAVSGYDPSDDGWKGEAASGAIQIADMQWMGSPRSFASYIEEGGNIMYNPQVFYLEEFDNPECKHFAPVNLPEGFTYDGDGHEVRGIAIDTNTDAGMFGTLTDSSVKNLKLLDFKVKTASGNAGALAGVLAADRTKAAMVENVVAYNSPTAESGGSGSTGIEAAGNAGGLVGAVEGGSIDSCAAAVYVASSNANAGGLVGNVSDGATISKSHSGGHTKGGVYQKPGAGEAEYNYNVQAEVEAGGLAGHVEGTETKIENCYATCSVCGSIAGGLVGSSESGFVRNCYAVGRVWGRGNDPTIGAFAGKYEAGGAREASNQYLKLINNTMPAVSGEDGGSDNASGIKDALEGSAAGGARSEDYNYSAFVPQSGMGKAIAYDSSLPDTFTYRTVVQLLGAEATDADKNNVILNTHYGDWQQPFTDVVNTKSASESGESGGIS